MEIMEFLSNQTQEALGSVNKWYCSQYYGYEVSDPEILLAYYIKHGGAQHYREQHQIHVEVRTGVQAC